MSLLVLLQILVFCCFVTDWSIEDETNKKIEGNPLVIENPMTMLIIFLLQTIPLIGNPPEKASIYAIIYLKLIG